MKKVIIYYSFIIVSIMTLTGFLQAKSPAQLISAVLFFPLALYFAQLVFPKNRRAPIIPKAIPLTPLDTAYVSKKGSKNPPAGGKAGLLGKITDEKAKEGIVLPKKEGFDIDRRMFLKLIGSAGVTVFLFSIFTKKAHGAFFGSAPGPGTVALKDSTGALIDPAIKAPTDAYKITEIDDGSPAYYGFVNKNGNWYIMQDTDGSYRYVKGDTNFIGNWGTHATREDYGYFNAVFGS
ncbi:MAG: hypothetical protein ABIC96_04470 [Patescibacteria group bacterium]